MATESLVLQPSVVALMERAHANLGSKATVLFHRSGQILAKNGDLSEEEYPTVAVLVAGMVAAGQSLAQVRGESENKEYQLSHGNSEAGVYAVRINQDYWVFSLYKEILNPGLFRMQMRRLAKEIEYHLKIMTNSAGAKTAPVETNGPRLFNNITDAEIDELFNI